MRRGSYGFAKTRLAMIYEIMMMTVTAVTTAAPVITASTAPMMTIDRSDPPICIWKKHAESYMAQTRGGGKERERK
jgi:hypothetical protein